MAVATEPNQVTSSFDDDYLDSLGEEFTDDDDDYEDDEFIDDTGTPIQDAPPLDIL